MENTDFTQGNLFSDEVDVDLDVFGTAMVDRVGCHVDSTDVVAVDDCGDAQRNVQVLQKLAQPTTLDNDVSNNLVLGLRTGPGHRGLPFGRPGHQIVSKEDTKT